MILHLSDEDHLSIDNFRLLNRYRCKKNYLSYINILKYYSPDILPDYIKIASFYNGRNCNITYSIGSIFKANTYNSMS